MNILLLLSGAGIGALSAFFFLLLILKSASVNSGKVATQHAELIALWAERNRLYAANAAAAERLAVAAESIAANINKSFE